MKNLNRNSKHNTESLVSVIMPVYNASKYVYEAIDSIINQTYTNWELIAVDDGSSDNSYEILREYANKDKRIKAYMNKENLGVSKTSNYAISKSQGKYMVRMDADDISYKTRLEKQIKFLKANPDYIVIGGQVKLISEKGKYLRNKNFPTKHSEIYEMMYTSMSIQQGAMMVNTSLAPEDFDWYNGVRTAEEVKLFFRLFNYGRFGNLDDYVLKYRQYDTSTSLKDAKETFKITYKTRKIAEKQFGYKASTKSKIISNIQNVLVTVLPNKLVYPTFIILRSVRLPKFSINVPINTKYAQLFNWIKKEILIQN